LSREASYHVPQSDGIQRGEQIPSISKDPTLAEDSYKRKDRSVYELRANKIIDASVPHIEEGSSWRKRGASKRRAHHEGRTARGV